MIDEKNTGFKDFFRKEEKKTLLISAVLKVTIFF